MIQKRATKIMPVVKKMATLRPVESLILFFFFKGDLGVIHCADESRTL